MRLRVLVLCALSAAFLSLLVGGIPALGTALLISLGVDAVALFAILCLSHLLTRGWVFLPWEDVDEERWERFEAQFKDFVDQHDD